MILDAFYGTAMGLMGFGDPGARCVSTSSGVKDAWIGEWVSSFPVCFGVFLSFFFFLGVDEPFLRK